jgi:hypothetical protein
MSNVTIKNCSISLKILDGNGQPTLFTAFTGDNGGLWWTAPTATQATNVVIKENDQDVTSIKIVQE